MGMESFDIMEWRAQKDKILKEGVSHKKDDMFKKLLKYYLQTKKIDQSMFNQLGDYYYEAIVEAEENARKGSNAERPDGITKW